MKLWDESYILEENYQKGGHYCLSSERKCIGNIPAEKQIQMLTVMKTLFV